MPIATPIARFPVRADLQEAVKGNLPALAPGDAVICFLGGTYCEGTVWRRERGRTCHGTVETLDDVGCVVSLDGDNDADTPDAHAATAAPPGNDAAPPDAAADGGRERMHFTHARARTQLRTDTSAPEQYEPAFGDRVEVRMPCRRFIEGESCRIEGCTMQGVRVELANTTPQQWGEGIIVQALHRSTLDGTLWAGVAFSPHWNQWCPVENVLKRHHSHRSAPAYGLQDANYPTTNKKRRNAQQRLPPPPLPLR